MRIANLQLNDKATPCEEILRLIREGKIKDVTITWKGAVDMDNPTFYKVSGEVDNEVLIRGLDLQKR